MSASTRMKKLGFAACLVALLALASASTAAASTTIGQLATDSATPTILCAGNSVDYAQPTVIGGNSYVVPQGENLITSWSTNAIAGAGQTLEMKVYRKVGDPATYKVVAHDGSHPLTPLKTNTFPVGIAVQPGDVLGVNSANAGTVMNACAFYAPGESFLYRNGGLADGASGAFTLDNGARVNASAVLVNKPSNSFSLGKVKDNRSNGTATLTLDLPGPGTLSLSGKGVKAQRTGRAARSSRAVNGGVVQLPIKAKGKAKRNLNRTGKVKVKVSITYTPTGEVRGDPNTQTKRVKLVKKG